MQNAQGMKTANNEYKNSTSQQHTRRLIPLTSQSRSSLHFIQGKRNLGYIFCSIARDCGILKIKTKDTIICSIEMEYSEKVNVHYETISHKQHDFKRQVSTLCRDDIISYHKQKQLSI